MGLGVGVDAVINDILNLFNPSPNEEARGEKVKKPRPLSPKQIHIYGRHYKLEVNEIDLEPVAAT